MTRLMLLMPEFSIRTDKPATTSQELPGLLSRPLCRSSLKATVVLGFGLTSFSNFTLKRFRNLCSDGRRIEAAPFNTRFFWNLSDWKAGNYFVCRINHLGETQRRGLWKGFAVIFSGKPQSRPRPRALAICT